MVERIQRLWRAKRVFTNNQGRWKISKPHVVSTISIVKFPVDMSTIFTKAPRGFTEVTGFKGAGQKASIRYADGKWIGDSTGVTRVAAKRGPQTIVITKGVITVLGTGNPEAAYLAIAKNGWSAKNLVRETPEYRKVDGVFYINKPFDLPGLDQEFRKLPKTMVQSVSYHPELKTVPAVVLKLKDPPWTYQFFENGTVLFTGIKTPKEINEPVKLFKQFGLTNVSIAFEKTPALRRPVAGKKNTSKLAERYPLAGTWNSLRKPYAGFYIRPGTNGKPRMYPYRFMRREAGTGEVLNIGPMNLRAVAPKVVKAFKNVGQPIPKVTMNAFASAGIPLESPKKKAVAAHANRRAPSWNATKNGFYVRPGAGQQPYWFAIPKGIESGRKTVIAAYTKAGRNIPAAVRTIFKIPASVAVNVKPKHNIAVGLNGVLRINGRQAVRLTVPELVAIARNMNIAEVNAKMKPIDIIQWIQHKSGLTGKRANKNFNVNLNGVKYKLLNNERVERTVGKTRTTRNWSTIPAANQNRIAKAFLNESYHEAYNLQPRNKKYWALMVYKNSLKPNTPSTASSAASSNNNNLANFAANLEKNMKNQSHKNAYRALVGNYYTNENANRLLTRLGKMPTGSKKANVNRSIKTFAKEAVVRTRRALIEANYRAKITAPNWIPVNKRNAYKNALLSTALQVNNKGKYPTQKSVRQGMQGWINAHIPKVATAAHTKENVLTGAVIHVPAWNPPKKVVFNVPKRLSPPRPSAKPRAPKATGPKAKKNTSKRRLNENSNNAENIGSAMIALGINTRGNYAWNNLVRAGMNKKYKNAWARQPTV
jgi:hypothetical protein